ncbi:MAG: hypothetical protein FJ086_05820 [Deltaproteobacteria bacterium]|nr:hypothetical protein [Deltaproteobacteria bacterium]
MRHGLNALTPAAALLLLVSGCGGKGPVNGGGGNYGLTVTARGEGSVLSTPVGVDCGPLCTAPFEAGSSVTLEAEPAAGGAFLGWSGDCDGTATSCAVKMDGERAVTAVFSVPLRVQVTTAGGKVTSSPAGIRCPELCGAGFAPGAVVALTATTDPGFTFAGWGGACSGTGSCTVTLEAATTVTAAFSPSTGPRTLAVTLSGPGQGTVTSVPTGVNCPGDCDESFPPGTQVTLTAVAAAGSTFGGWSGGCTGSAPTCKVALATSTSVTATFGAEPPPTLTVVVSGAGKGTVASNPSGISCPGDCNEAFTAGTSVTLVATPAAGSVFTGWSGGVCSGTGVCALPLAASVSITAVFAPEPPPRLTVGLMGNGSGTVTSSPSGISCPGDCTEAYGTGTTVTLTAAPAQGATFAGWSGACSGTGTCTVTVAGAQSVSARFVLPGSPCNWAYQLTGTLPASGSGRDAVTGISLEPGTGRILLVGALSGSASLAGGTVLAPGAYGNMSAMVLDPTGTTLQSSFSRGSTQPVGVVMSGQGAWIPGGDIALGVQLSGSMDFGGGATLVQSSAWRTYVAAYSTTGTLKWVKAGGKTSNSYLMESLHGLAVDPASGAVVLGSRYEETDTFGTSTTHNHAGFGDAMVARFGAASGQVEWVRTAGAANPDDIFSVAVGPSGQVAFAGAFGGAADFGGGAFASSQPFSAVLGAYAADGTFQFNRAIANGSGRAVAVASNGDLVVAGGLWGAADFGGSVRTPAGASDAFVARYTSSGALVWARLLGGPGSDEASAVALDPSTGDVWVAGDFTQSVGFTGAPVTAAGQADVFAVKLSGTTGDVLQARTWGGPDNDVPLALAVDDSGNVLMGGEFSGASSLGGGAPFVASGFSDGFALCFTP